MSLDNLNEENYGNQYLNGKNEADVHFTQADSFRSRQGKRF